MSKAATSVLLYVFFCTRRRFLRRGTESDTAEVKVCKPGISHCRYKGVFFLRLGGMSSHKWPFEKCCFLLMWQVVMTESKSEKFNLELFRMIFYHSSLEHQVTLYTVCLCFASIVLVTG